MLPDPRKLLEAAPFNQFSASLAETAARKILTLDPEADPKQFQLEEKLVQLHISDLDLDYFISFEEGKINISNSLPDTKGADPAGERTVSALIKGDLKAFIAAASDEHSGDSIFTGELVFTGEINTAKKFQAFAQSLQIDWQEPFAQVFGDPVGHTLTSGISHFSGWLKGSLDSFKLDVKDYLTEESRVTPSESELNHFCQSVDQVRSQADRLSARIAKLTESDAKNSSLESNKNKGTNR